MKEIVEVVAEALVPQILEQTVEVFKSILQVRASERVVEQIADVSVPRVTEEVARLIRQEFCPERIVEEIVDILVPQVQRSKWFGRSGC